MVLIGHVQGQDIHLLQHITMLYELVVAVAFRGLCLNGC